MSHKVRAKSNIVTLRMFIERSSKVKHVHSQFRILNVLVVEEIRVTLTCCGFLGLPGPLFFGSAGAGSGSGCSCDPEASPAASSPRALIVCVSSKQSLAHLLFLQHELAASQSVSRAHQCALIKNNAFKTGALMKGMQNVN